MKTISHFIDEYAGVAVATGIMIFGALGKTLELSPIAVFLLGLFILLTQVRISNKQ